MTNEVSSTEKSRWPSVIAIFCCIYSLLYFALTSGGSQINQQTSLVFFKLAACLLLFIGGIGLILRRKWGISAAQSGSFFVIIQLVIAIFVIVKYLGGGPPFFVLLGMLTLLLPTLSLPVFLLFWFSRQTIKDEVKNKWN